MGESDIYFSSFCAYRNPPIDLGCRPALLKDQQSVGNRSLEGAIIMDTAYVENRRVGCQHFHHIISTA